MTVVVVLRRPRVLAFPRGCARSTSKINIKYRGAIHARQEHAFVAIAANKSFKKWDDFLRDEVAVVIESPPAHKARSPPALERPETTQVSNSLETR